MSKIKAFRYEVVEGPNHTWKWLGIDKDKALLMSFKGHKVEECEVSYTEWKEFKEE